MPRLVAVEIGAFPSGLLEGLLPEAAAALELEVTMASFHLDPEIGYDGRRGQVLAVRLIEELRRLTPPEDRVIGAAAVDLFNPVLTFVFGEAEMPGRVAVFSIYRLRQEFYGLPADQGLLAERAAKEMIHEVGHTFGLAHCADASCVMSASHSVEAVDLKGNRMCPKCRRRRS